MGSIAVSLGSLGDGYGGGYFLEGILSLWDENTRDVNATASDAITCSGGEGEALTLGGASSVDDVKTGGHGDELVWDARWETRDGERRVKRGGDETRGSTETGEKDSRGSGEHEGKRWEMERC